MITQEFFVVTSHMNRKLVLIEMLHCFSVNVPLRQSSIELQPCVKYYRSEKRKRLLNSESDLAEDYPKENDSSR